MKPTEPIQLFRLNGKRYSFVRSQVEKAVHNQTPRRIDKYQVLVAGAYYPPKQVIERLTEVEPISFTTMDAQRILKKFGYVVEVANQAGEEKSAEGRTLSEQYFEHYLQSNGFFHFEFEPSLPGTTRKPDYRLQIGSNQVLFEVKQLQFSNKDLGFPQGAGIRGRAVDPYAPIRQKIDDAREKFKGLKDEVCCLVLFNENKPIVDLNWQMVYGAMLGNIYVSTPLNRKFSELNESEITWGLGLNGKCTPNMNTTISAVVTLEPLMLGERRFRCHMSKLIGEANPKFKWDEIFALERLERDKARGTERDFTNIQWRVVVHENPWARNKLNRDLFKGRFDERYGDHNENGSIQRIFAGEAVQELESLERDYPLFGANLRNLAQRDK